MSFPYVFMTLRRLKDAEKGNDMPIFTLIIIGAAAGFLATRLMRLNTDVPTTVGIGVLGALLGGMVLRFLVMITGWMAGFVGAILGAMLLIWLWKTYISR